MNDKNMKKVLGDLEALASMSDDEIDTEDIPEVRDWSDAVRGKYYNPVKKQISMRVETDVLEWYRSSTGGKGYQTLMNKVLRDHMITAMVAKSSGRTGKAIN